MNGKMTLRVWQLLGIVLTVIGIVGTAHTPNENFFFVAGINAMVVLAYWGIAVAIWYGKGENNG